MANLQFYDIKFPHDSVYQQLLKPVNVSPIYSNYKRRGGGVFWDNV